jgi:hypothetical protein
MRKIFGIAAIAIVIASGIHCLGSSQAGYPLAPDVSGPMGVLARTEPEILTRTSAEDVERLSHALSSLDAAVYQAEQREALLSAEKIDTLRADERESIREVWADLFEPLMTIEELKERYRFFWTIDYSRNPRLHSRAFGIAYAAMCAEVEAGQKLFKLMGQGKVAPILFDEEMANRGVPRGSFQSFRLSLSNAVEQGWVPTGRSWYDTWIKKHLGDGGMNAELQILVRKRYERAEPLLGVRATLNAANNSAELMAGEAFRRFLPAQKSVAEWLGDTRVVPQDRRLISDAQIHEMQKSMRPGDIIVERRNWYLSNIGLPGFWPHAAMYAGTVEDLRKTFDEDPDVKAKFGRFTEHLEKNRPQAFVMLAKKDNNGHPHSVIEAVSEGVVIASLEHSCGADYVGVLRPRMPLVDVASAIDRAFSYYGRPYDFNFDFGTDDQLVCSELVLKSYEPRSENGPGLRIPYLTVAGRRVGLPTEIVRQFGVERNREDRQLDFVYFLDGREKTKNALVSDANAFAESVNRPKWDVAQQ